MRPSRLPSHPYGARRRHIISALVLAAVVALLPAAPHRLHAAPAAQATPAPSEYRLTFDNYVTSAPLPYGANRDLDVLVHSRDTTSWANLEPMAISHGPACEAPPATHQSPNPMPYADAVFICAANPHLMTAINAGGYGVIYLTPGAMVDFSAGEAVLRFDVSTFRSSTRDWWDLWVTPYDDLMAAPLDAWVPDLQGPPKRGLHIRMDTLDGKSTFRAERIDNHVVSDIGAQWWLTYESVLTPSASRRDTFELRISRTHVRWALLNGATGQPLMTWTDYDTADLGWDTGVVQIGHHSYNPTKDGGTPGTWHWDNVSLSPASPFTLIPAQQRRANAGQPVYTFGEPAPSNSTLHVLALADTLEASLDGGTTWAAMGRRDAGVIHWGGRSSFAMPVPAGTTSVRLRGTERSGNWDAGHAAITSLAPRGTPPMPTLLPPTSTPFPTETPTPVPPTSTPTPAPQATIRINAAGPAYTDGQSRTWIADAHYGSGTATDSFGGDITGTTDDALYLDVRHAPSFSYAIPVANGTYDVTLKLAEVYYQGAGQRVFDVAAEGATVVDDLDMVASAGFKAASDRTFRVTVADGTLSLDFAASVDRALVGAIEVVPVVPPTATPVPPTHTPTPIPPQCRRPYERSTDGGATWTQQHEAMTCP